jgi:hypothetical protein
MLAVNLKDRWTIDQIAHHPWLTHNGLNGDFTFLGDYTDVINPSDANAGGEEEVGLFLADEDLGLHRRHSDVTTKPRRFQVFGQM